MSALTKTTVKGVLWLMGQSAAFRLINLATQIVLARLLMKEDFGMLALASTVTTIIGMLQNFGIEDFLVQRQRKMVFWTKPAFLVAIGLGVLSMLAIVCTAPFVADFYQSPNLWPMLAIMSLSMPLGALSTLSAAELRASLRFKFLAAYNTGDQLFTQSLTIVLALSGFGPFSFAVPGPVAALIRAIVYWKLVPPFFRKLKSGQLRMIGSKGATLFGTKLVTALIGQGDYIILGLTASKAEIGAYYFAYRLAFQPVAALAGNFKSVLVPGLIHLRADLSRQRSVAFEAAEILAYSIMPASFLIVCLAPTLFPLAFGHKWDSAIPLVQILSVALAFDAVAWIAGGLLEAQGKFETGFRLAALLAPIFFLCVYVGAVIDSATGAAVGVFVYYIINGPTYYFVVFKKSGFPVLKILKVCFFPAILSLATIAAPYYAAAILVPGHLSIAIFATIVGCTLYLIGLRLMCRNVWKKGITRFQKLISKGFA